MLNLFVVEKFSIKVKLHILTKVICIWKSMRLNKLITFAIP